MRFGRDLFSPIDFQVEDEMSPVRERYGEAFWRAHHEAWTESELNQREYCEAYGIPLKAFGNWRAKFKAEPQLPARKVLYRCGSGPNGSLGTANTPDRWEPHFGQQPSRLISVKS